MSLLLQQPQPLLHHKADEQEDSRGSTYVYFALLVVGFAVVCVGAASVFSRAALYVGAQPHMLMLGPAASLNGEVFR